jgi:hypothetical protein
LLGQFAGVSQQLLLVFVGVGGGRGLLLLWGGMRGFGLSGQVAGALGELLGGGEG